MEGVGALATAVYVGMRCCGGRSSRDGMPFGKLVEPLRTRRSAPSRAKMSIPAASTQARATAGTGAEGGDPRLQDTAAHSLTGGVGTGVTTLAAPADDACVTMEPGTRQLMVTAATATSIQRQIGAICPRLSLPAPWRAVGSRPPHPCGGPSAWPSP
jgi:hypothetical protein